MITFKELKAMNYEQFAKYAAGVMSKAKYDRDFYCSNIHYADRIRSDKWIVCQLPIWNWALHYYRLDDEESKPEEQPKVHGFIWSWVKSDGKGGSMPMTDDEIKAEKAKLENPAKLKEKKKQLRKARKKFEIWIDGGSDFAKVSFPEIRGAYYEINHIEEQLKELKK